MEVDMTMGLDYGSFGLPSSVEKADDTRRKTCICN
jgi:hypothetical protein